MLRSFPHMPILDRLLPVSDAARVEHRIISAPLATAFDAAVTTDFLDAPRVNPAVRALFTVRTSLERLTAALDRRPFFPAPATPSLTLEELPERGEWIRLGESPPFEIAFGAIGQFWSGETRWARITSNSFAGFDEPGYARIGGSLVFAPLGEGTTALTYEARAQATDDASRRALVRYWRVTSPFAGFIMRATLTLMEQRAIAGVLGRNLEQAWATAGR